MPTITKPTRITHSSATLTDNIYILKNRINDFKSCTIVSDISDHLPCLTMTSIRLTQNNKIVTKSKKFSEANISSIKNNLAGCDWANLRNLDANSGYNNFLETFIGIIDEYAP